MVLTAQINALCKTARITTAPARIMKNEYVWLREACQLYKFMHIWACEHLPVQIIYAVRSVKGQ